MNNSNKFQTELTQRGFAEQASAAGWRANGRGWTYPIFDIFTGEQVATRFKASKTSSGQKYLWPDGKGRARYYAGHGLGQAITDHDGLLYIVNGEPAVLTMQAAGWHNVLCWFGETSVPRALADDLKRLGVRRALYIADNDRAGRESAAKVRDYLADSGIAFQALDLAGKVPEKGDTNDLWIAHRFNSADFNQTLISLPALILPQKPVKKLPPQTDYSAVNGDDWPPDFIRDVVAALLRQPRASERDGQILCCSPFRDEEKPSFSFSTEKCVGYDFTTGEGYGIIATGAALGIDIKDYRPTPAKPTKRRGLGGKPDIAPEFVLEPADLRGRWTPDVTVNAAYCSDAGIDTTPRTIALKSPLATGKTELIRRIFADHPGRVLALTHLVSLSQDVARRLQTDHYSNFDGQYATAAGSMQRMTCTANSLYKVAGARPYDVVFIDEFTQFMNHFFSKTFTGDEATTAYSVLVNILKRAKKVIVADAHMTDAAAAWLADIRGDVVKVENAYQPERGLMNVYQYRDGLIARASAVADAQIGPVVIPCSSRQQSEFIAEYFQRRYGAGQVLLVNSLYTTEPAQREFLDDINAGLKRYRVIVHTSTIGTGVDVQTPVAAVFGVFSGNHIASNDMLQMVMRYRNAAERGVYISHGQSSGQPPTSSELLERERGKVLRTRKLADLTPEDVTAIQGAMMRLWGSLEADRRRLTHDLRGTFVTLATGDGFTLQPVTRRSELVAASMKAARDDIKEAHEAATLAAEPVSFEQIDALRMSGELRRFHFFGLDRYTVEITTGHEINAQLLKEYGTPSGRRELIRMADMVGREERDRDRVEVEKLPVDRTHATAHQKLLLDAVEAVFGREGLLSTERIAAPELAARARAFVDANFDALVAFDGRDDLSRNPIAVIRRILKRFGLRLAYEYSGAKHAETGKREMIYWHDIERYYEMNGRAIQRLMFKARWARAKEDAENAGSPDIDYREFLVKNADDPPDGASDTESERERERLEREIVF